jgi:hypothetical protein
MKYESFFTPKMKFILILVVAAALSRLLPHPLNFSPIGAIALFAGAFIHGRGRAWLLPMAALLLSDVLLQIYNQTGFYRDMIFVYGSFAAVVFIGRFLETGASPLKVMACSLSASVLFFAVTNFGSWLMYDMYPKTAAGLMQSYMAGIPFFRGTLLGDLFYSAVLFGSYALARRRFPVLA